MNIHKYNVSYGRSSFNASTYMMYSLVNSYIHSTHLYNLRTILHAGDDAPVVPIYVRKSTLRLPYRSTCPVIMVGPGTGLTPFRGFIEDRCVIKKKDGEDLTINYFKTKKHVIEMI